MAEEANDVGLAYSRSFHVVVDPSLSVITYIMIYVSNAVVTVNTLQCHSSVYVTADGMLQQT